MSIEEYNGASFGFSPFDMIDWECHNWGETNLDDEESDEVECCDCGAVGNYEDFYLDKNEHWLCPDCRDFYKEKGLI